MTIRVGCTGWSYNDWYANGFYAAHEEARFRQGHAGMNYRLWRYSRFFDCTEVNSFAYVINATGETALTELGVPPTALWWYKKQQETTKPRGAEQFERLASMTRVWERSTPDDFLFTAKAPGMITHAKCLRACASETRLFLKGLEPLGGKLSSVLFEFPSYVTKENSFAAFKDYFSRYPGKAAVEFRSADWQCTEVHDFLRERKITLVLSEVTDPGVTTAREPLGDEAYIRIIGSHGTRERFERMTLDAEHERTLQRWAALAKASRHATVFINNNFAGNAPETANRFKQLAGMNTKEWASDLRDYF